MTETADENAWPWFLPEPSAEPVVERPYEQIRGEFEDTPFIVRARALLDFVGDGRDVEAGGTLGDDDTATLMEQLGIERDATTMLECPELVGPWITLYDGEWIRIEGRRATRGDGIAPATSPETDPEGYATFVQTLLARLMGSMIERTEDEGGFAATPETLAALMVASRPMGLTMPHPEEVLRADRPQEELAPYVDTLQDLGRLTLYGLLATDPDDRMRFWAPGILEMAIDAAVTAIMQTRDARED